MYRIFETEVYVDVLSAYGHYDDKWFLHFLPVISSLVEMTKGEHCPRHKETEAADFYFSIIIFGEQIKNLLISPPGACPHD